MCVQEMNVPRNVPQCSVLDPTLWNIVYKNLLCTYFSPRFELIGFTVNLATVFLTKDHYILEYLLNSVLNNIHVWITSEGLAIASHKLGSMLQLTKN